MAARLHIDELALQCHVHEEVVRSTRAREVLDRVLNSAARSLPEVLDRALAAEPESDEIVFIDTLRFEAAINAEWSAEQIAKALALPLLRGLWASGDAHVVRFRDRGEMLASFLLQLARGHSYSQPWHQRMFGGLQLLPHSALVRTLVQQDPDTALDALARLLPQDLEILVRLLNQNDSERVLGAITELGRVPCRDPLAIAQALVVQRCASLDQPHRAIALAVAIYRETASMVDEVTVSFARALLTASAVPAAESGKALLLQIIAKSTRAHELLHVAATLSEETVTRAIERLRTELDVEDLVEHRSPCGGLWLLLPHVVAEGAACNEEIHAALALAAGPDALHVWCDPALCAVFDIVPTVPVQHARAVAVTPVGKSRWRQDVAHLRQAARQLALARPLRCKAARIAHRAFKAYAHRLPGFGDASLPHLWTNLLATPASVSIRDRRVDVRLDAPPLDVIFRISGADRASYKLADGFCIDVGVRR